MSTSRRAVRALSTDCCRSARLGASSGDSRRIQIDAATETGARHPRRENMTNDIAVVDTDAVAEPAPRRRDQRGMVSAEWAVGIIAAIAIAGVLLGIVT